jgi:hypothetical protein
MLHHLGTSDQRYLAEPIMPCAADITTHHPSTLNDQLLHCVQKPAASASFQTTLPQSNRWLPPACRSLLKPPNLGVTTVLFRLADRRLQAASLHPSDSQTCQRASDYSKVFGLPRLAAAAAGQANVNHPSSAATLHNSCAQHGIEFVSFTGHT